jgi:hypothetical protein
MTNQMRYGVSAPPDAVSESSESADRARVAARGFRTFGAARGLRASAATDGLWALRRPTLVFARPRSSYGASLGRPSLEQIELLPRLLIPALV